MAGYRQDLPAQWPANHDNFNTKPLQIRVPTIVSIKINPSQIKTVIFSCPPFCCRDSEDARSSPSPLPCRAHE
jgi:hypothetical protein